jgi:hypothetical protein
MEEQERSRQVWDGQWVRPGDLDRRQETVVRAQPATAAAMKQEMDARFRAYARQMGGDEMTTARINSVAVHGALIAQYRPEPWAEAMMREAVEDNQREQKELHRRYMEWGSGTREEIITTTQTRQQRNY